MLWIIGYGNPQRRDDGLGPYVISQLQDLQVGRHTVHLLGLHQLGPELAEELRDAEEVVFVDATVEELDGGWEWREVGLRNIAPHYLTHHTTPSFLMGLLQSCYHRSPRAWMVSIQGEDFGLGDGLTPGAECRALEVVHALVRFANPGASTPTSFSCAKDRTDIRVMVNPQREGGAHGCRD
jgi:hydrogenase maturation protease